MSSVPPVPLTCARVRVLLESCVDGDLAREDATTAAAVRDHLATCADCRRQHEQAASLPFRLKALSSPKPPASLVGAVMQSITPEPAIARRAWILVLPEAVLATFILWYLSGLDGLSSIASGTLGDLQTLAGWGAGTTDLPRVPPVDVILVVALIALTAVAAYHLSILVRIAPSALPTRRAARE